MFAESPDVTVVIPTRDRWPLLEKLALPAALGQEGVDQEVIVVDDGSADETHLRLTEASGPRLRVLRHDEPRGVARARNAGIAAARGTWLAFLDDDDIWSPHKLRLQLDAARREHADFAYGAAVWLDEDLGFLYGHDPPDPGRLAPALLRWNVLWGGCSNVVARADLVRRLGGFDEALSQLADWDLWIRLARAGRAAVCLEAVVALVAHSGSMLLTDRRDVGAEFEYLVEKHRAASLEEGVDFDRARFARWTAAGHLRAGRRLASARVYLRGAWAAGDAGGLVRAGAALFGQRAARRGRALAVRVRRRPPGERVAVAPDWLGLYR